MEVVSCAAASAGRPRSGSGFASRQDDEDASPAAAAVASVRHHPVVVSRSPKPLQIDGQAILRLDGGTGTSNSLDPEGS